jgi:hypothetical protein
MRKVRLPVQRQRKAANVSPVPFSLFFLGLVWVTNVYIIMTLYYEQMHSILCAV